MPNYLLRTKHNNTISAVEDEIIQLLDNVGFSTVHDNKNLFISPCPKNNMERFDSPMVIVKWKADGTLEIKNCLYHKDVVISILRRVESHVIETVSRKHGVKEFKFAFKIFEEVG